MPLFNLSRFSYDRACFCFLSMKLLLLLVLEQASRSLQSQRSGNSLLGLGGLIGGAPIAGPGTELNFVLVFYEKL